MAKQLKLRRGTTSQHSSFTGAEGEVTVDTTKDTVVVHDGSTAGGIPLAKESAAYTHPNHSGEVTSSADGAQTIADNVVDEANLKVSNSPTNGQFLSAQSGNTGGLTWATIPTADLTNLNATNLTSGTVPNARFPATLPAVSGANLTSLNAANLTGYAPLGVLGTGWSSYTTSKYLSANGSWENFPVTTSISSDSNENTILGTTNASGGNSNDNVVIGYQAGHGLSAGHENILVGYQSGYNISGGDRNTVLGYKALYDNNVDNVIAIGYKCGEGLSGNYNILIGDNVCESSNQSGSMNVSIGSSNLRYGSGWQYNTLVGGNNFGVSNSAADYCVALGYGALYSSTTGNQNTASGYYALNDVTTGYENSAVGSRTLEYLTTGSRNTAIGYKAGSYSTNLTTGSYNILIGYQPQPSSSTVSGEVTIGDYNITKFRVPGINFTLKDNNGTPSAGKVLTADSNGEGYWADGGVASDSQYNTVGGTTGFSSNSNTTKNTIFGYQAGHSINGSTGSGDDNTIIGYRAMASSDKGFNTAVGIQAMENSSGQYMTAIGRMAGQNYYGSSSIFIGGGAGARGTTNSYYNVVIGNNAFYEAYNWPGQRNVALGESVGYRNAGASDSTIVGHYTLFDATTATQNTTLGSEALRKLTTGTGNIAIGYRAGYSQYGSNALTTGSNNIIIGKDAQASSATVSNEITLGNSSVSSLRCQVQSISSLSDRRDKTDINTLDLGLDFINSLKPVKFKWASREGILKDGTYDAGFIAQDLQQVQKDNNADYLGLVLDTNPDRLEASYGNLIPMLVQAVKELSAKVAALEAK